MSKSVKLIFFSLFLCLGFIEDVHAGKCGEYVFKHGWLRKYKYAHNTTSQNASKFGISTLFDYISETTTSITDPGVTTGLSSSTKSFFSSKGDCSAWKKLFGSYYIEQNLDDIRKQIAYGTGEHLNALAYFSGCKEQAVEKFSRKMNEEYDRFAEFKDNEGEKFLNEISKITKTDALLKESCNNNLI